MTPIPGFEGLYTINKMGEVHSLPRKVIGSDGVTYPIKGQLLTNQLHKQTGYIQVDLWKDNKGHRFYIHRLLATIYIPNPDNKPEVNHINSNRQDFALTNLEWVTSSENSLHAYKTGFASQAKRRKLVETDYKTILTRFLNGESFAAILKDFNISPGRLSINLRSYLTVWGKEAEYQAEKHRQQKLRAQINGAN